MTRGKPFSKGFDARRDISKGKENLRPYIPGNTHPKWNGGNSQREFEFSQNNKQALIKWSKAVRESQNNICQRCGVKDSPRMAAHHIKSKLEYPDLAFEISNGMTYCNSCHTKLHWEIAKEREELNDRLVYEV